jgi:excisionase family DNA binding protein
VTLLTSAQVAEMLAVPRSRVDALARGRAIAFVEFGPRTRRFTLEAVEEYIARRIVGTREETGEEIQRRRQRIQAHGKARQAVVRDRHRRVDARRPAGPPIPLRRDAG